MRRTLVALFVSAVAIVPAACGGSSSGADHRMGSMPRHGAGGTMMHEHEEATPVAPGARRIPVAATSFSYDPEVITVAVGEDIAVVLSSDDILHDFTIDELDVHVAADRGETAEGGLRADTLGEYAFYCAVAGHREAGMEGTLIVEAS